MAGVIANYAAKKVLSRQMNKYKDKDPLKAYDPLFYEVPHPRKPGKTKKVKKQIPDYIPEHDAMVLARARSRAYHLDCALFTIFGQRFGWSSVIGIVPAAGDFLDGLLALQFWYLCRKVEGGLPRKYSARMLLNIIIDFFIGFVPFLGDIFDAYFKCNSKNCLLLEKYLDERYKPQELVEREKSLQERRKRGEPVNYVPSSPATVYEEFSDDELPRHNTAAEPRRPEATRVPRETRGDVRAEATRSNGWFSGGNKRERQPDLESGGQRRERSQR